MEMLSESNTQQHQMAIEGNNGAVMKTNEKFYVSLELGALPFQCEKFDQMESDHHP